MAVRIRMSGDIICAAMSIEEPGDLYIDDELHYYLSVTNKLLLADENHKINGLWHWRENNAL